MLYGFGTMVIRLQAGLWLEPWANLQAKSITSSLSPAWRWLAVCSDALYTCVRLRRVWPIVSVVLQVLFAIAALTQAQWPIAGCISRFFRYAACFAWGYCHHWTQLISLCVPSAHRWGWRLGDIPERGTGVGGHVVVPPLLAWVHGTLGLAGRLFVGWLPVNAPRYTHAARALQGRCCACNSQATRAPKALNGKASHTPRWRRPDSPLSSKRANPDLLMWQPITDHCPVCLSLPWSR